mmetsp:Transcript_79343/g.222776  ORF Transcript_79343/g.222776 Transcript_79343/m.222776 type:complete len:208 (+) Transcript_79343:191-814(+)
MVYAKMRNSCIRKWFATERPRILMDKLSYRNRSERPRRSSPSDACKRCCKWRSARIRTRAAAGGGDQPRRLASGASGVDGLLKLLALRLRRLPALAAADAACAALAPGGDSFSRVLAGLQEVLRCRPPPRRPGSGQGLPRQRRRAEAGAEAAGAAAAGLGDLRGLGASTRRRGRLQVHQGRRCRRRLRRRRRRAHHRAQGHAPGGAA